MSAHILRQRRDKLHRDGRIVGPVFRDALTGRQERHLGPLFAHERDDSRANGLLEKRRPRFRITRTIGLKLAYRDGDAQPVIHRTAASNAPIGQGRRTGRPKGKDRIRHRDDSVRSPSQRLDMNTRCLVAHQDQDHLSQQGRQRAGSEIICKRFKRLGERRHRLAQLAVLAKLKNPAAVVVFA